VNWLLGFALLFCGGVMMLDGRADGERLPFIDDDDGGGALWTAGLIVLAGGVFVLISAVRGAS
jgi:hypothetical protein